MSFLDAVHAALAQDGPGVFPTGLVEGVAYPVDSELAFARVAVWYVPTVREVRLAIRLRPMLVLEDRQGSVGRTHWASLEAPRPRRKEEVRQVADWVRGEVESALPTLVDELKHQRMEKVWASDSWEDLLYKFSVAILHAPDDVARILEELMERSRHTAARGGLHSDLFWLEAARIAAEVSPDRLRDLALQTLARNRAALFRVGLGEINGPPNELAR